MVHQLQNVNFSLEHFLYPLLLSNTALAHICICKYTAFCKVYVTQRKIGFVLNRNSG